MAAKILQPTPAPSALPCEQVRALNEARDRLHGASLAMGALLGLITGKTCVDGDGLYYLLAPVDTEIEKARNCLEIAAGGDA